MSSLRCLAGQDKNFNGREDGSKLQGHAQEPRGAEDTGDPRDGAAGCRCCVLCHDPAHPHLPLLLSLSITPSSCNLWDEAVVPPNQEGLAPVLGLRALSSHTCPCHHMAGCWEAALWEQFKGTVPSALQLHLWPSFVLLPPPPPGTFNAATFLGSVEDFPELF